MLVEPQWPSYAALALYGLTVLAAFVLARDAVDRFGRGFGDSDSALHTWLPFLGIVAGAAAMLLCHFAALGVAALIRRRLRTVGTVSDGTVHEISADLRKPPRGPERLVVTVTVWFSDDPKNPYPSDRAHAALMRYFTFRPRDTAQSDAFRDRYRIGTAVRVYLGRRRILYTTDLDPTRLAWFQPW
ncbi:hypothetical protein ACH46_16370 [Gordonia phthalatica]|uniref:DUF3592 domain-containing protein n=1 Tax=Gordonia phthalatica TaxID=1136941 RepID=A0A0N9NJH3_9ACTN|nr:hypothetical protein ACH46_16370 [Gordonia phthalatica]